MKKIYVVLSQTPSIVAKMIKAVTHKEYSHASLSLTEDLQWMYSFGRLHPYNPFWAGFVRESPDKGTMKRFNRSKITVLEVKVSDEEFEGVRSTINRMLSEQKKYHYNYIGLFKAGLNKEHNRKEYCYYCSEFVSDVLKKNSIYGSEMLPNIVHPVNFLDLPYNVVYKGRLRDYHIS